MSTCGRAVSSYDPRARAHKQNTTGSQDEEHFDHCTFTLTTCPVYYLYLYFHISSPVSLKENQET